MIVFTAHLRHASCRTDPCDRITTGSVGIPVRFAFSAEWDGLGKVAVFRGSGKSVDVLLTGDECCIPPEVLTQPGDVLSIGVYGTDGSGELAIPTVYADAGRIHRGAEPSGIEPSPQTQSLVEQLLAAAQAARDAAAAAEALAQSVRDDADSGVFAEQAADMVLLVSDTEPTVEPLPKIWIDSGSSNTILLPTMDDIGDLSDLVTTAKGNLVAAINEAAQSGGGSGTGDYDDLINQPKINGVELSGNKTAEELNLAPAGAYVKPSTGIPASDLTEAVQKSLGKANTALQQHQSLAGYATESWVRQQGYLTQHQSLTAYRTAAAQDEIDAGKADKVQEVTVATDGAVSQALDAGKVYHFTGALTDLTLTLNAAAAGQQAQYHFDFVSGSTAPTVTIPASVTMPDGWTVEASKRYEIDILDGYAVAQGWGVST